MKADFDKEMDRLLRGHTEVARRGGAGSASDSAHATKDAQPRGNGHDSPATEDAALSAHLDTDELVAYAENALPSVSRPRYAAHLADCDRCRKIVTSIALASGVAVERSDAAATATATVPVDKSSSVAGWRGWLAALFAPRTLRYVAPVLALSLVGVVAFVAIRQQSSAPLMSRQNETTQSVPSTAMQPAQSQPESQTTTTTTTATTGTTDANTSTGTLTTSPETGEKTRAPEARSEGTTTANRELIQPAAPPSSASLSSGVSATTIAAADAAAPPAPAAPTAGPLEQRAATEVARKEATQNEPAAASPRPAPSTYVLTDDNSNKDEVTRNYPGAANTFNMNRSATGGGKGTGGGESEQSRAQARQAEELRVQTAEDDRRRDEDRAARSSRPLSARSAQQPAARRRSKQAESSSESEPDSKEAKREATNETRSVAGRQFRRQSGGAWIDTAYRSKQSVTNVSRGSEQFRALVADEPGIARISRELGGEVVVVWKGRAYRIR
ncbi:MAG TPA: hypothetical protein VGB73_16065 [Pyrinomonadaceae bacterium]